MKLLAAWLGALVVLVGAGAFVYVHWTTVWQVGLTVLCFFGIIAFAGFLIWSVTTIVEESILFRADFWRKTWLGS